jgi:hypothetical protein
MEGMRIAAALLSACSFAPGSARPSDGGPVALRPDAVDARPDAPGPTVTFVQSTSAVSNPFAIAVDDKIQAQLTVAAGDTVALYVSYDGAGMVTSIDDTGNDLFHLVDKVDDGANNQSSTSAYAVAVAGGTTTVTVSFDVFICCRILILEELAGASALDAHSKRFQGSPGPTADAITSNPTTTAHDGDLIVAFTSDGADVGNQVEQPGTGETMRESIDNTSTGGNATASEDRAQATAGPVTSTFTEAVNGGTSLTLQMAFRP